jgi:nicotinamidase-related amidase
MRWWEEIFSAEERAIYQTYQQELTERPHLHAKQPALIVVDVTLAFCGRPGQSLVESVKEWPPSCGPHAWESIPYILQLLQAVRAARRPVIYTTAQPGSELFFGGVVKRKSVTSASPLSRPGAIDIPLEIAPQEDELVLRKPKASAFFATPLLAHLYRQSVDALITCGATTSGCVRATVVDGFSWGFPVYVVEEAVFDRSRLSQAVNLYEMNVKYADVLTVNETLAWLAQLPEAAESATAG